MSPLRHAVFRALWLAGLASQIGTWVQNVGAGWLMTTLASSPLHVALLQTATSLPFFLIGAPAGALADVFGRRRLVVLAQVWMLAVSLSLAALAALEVVTPWLLLALTFALGLGVAVHTPAWSVLVIETVPRAELLPAVTLGGVAINTARALGPALGGALIAAVGVTATFGVNAMSFVVVLTTLTLLRLPAPPPGQEHRGLSTIVYSSVRDTLRTRRLRPVFARAALFAGGASCLWGLLPVIARDHLGLGASGFGILLGLVGAGAVAGSIVLARLRPRVAGFTLSGAGTLIFAGSLVALALTDTPLVAGFLMVLLGGGWISLLSTLHAAAQLAVPLGRRSGAFAVHLLVFQGSMAAGSLVWGLVAARTSVPDALIVAALFLLLGLIPASRLRLLSELREEN